MPFMDISFANEKRKFEKISFEQFKKDYSKITYITDEAFIKTIYDNIKIPRRATKGSAGYDFSSTMEFVLPPNKVIHIPTGIKASMKSFDVLKMYIRSSVGFKFQTVLVNSVGIIDRDYYNNPDNEGHIQIKLINHGEKPISINIGENVCQGIFEKYFITDDDCPKSEERTGGIGSTSAK